jgi:hypothetical protein
MMVMARMAADVCSPPLGGCELADGAALAEELDGSVDGGEPDSGLALPRQVVHVHDGEVAGLTTDGVEYRLPLRRRACPGWQVERAHCGTRVLRMILNCNAPEKRRMTVE